MAGNLSEMTNDTKSYVELKVVENHDWPRLGETRHLEEEKFPIFLAVVFNFCSVREYCPEYLTMTFLSFIILNAVNWSPL